MLRNFFHENNIQVDDFQLVAEPGRSLVEDNGFLITGARLQKAREAKNIVVTDAGLHLVRSMHSWYHPISLINTTQDESQELSFTYDVYGSNCFESDILARGFVSARRIEHGDLFIIGSAGGYDLSTANVWTRPSPPIFGIINDSVILIRHAQREENVRNLQISLKEGVYVS